MANPNLPSVSVFPGFVYDSEKKRYFAVTNGDSTFNSQYSNNAVQADLRREKFSTAKKEKEDAESRDKALQLNKHLHMLPRYPENLLTSLKLGAVQMLYFQWMLSFLKSCSKQIMRDVSLWPYPADLMNKPCEFIYFKPLTRSVGTAKLPLKKNGLLHRYTTNTPSVLLSGFKTPSYDLIFCGGHQQFQCVNHYGELTELDQDFLTMLRDPYNFIDKHGDKQLEKINTFETFAFSETHTYFFVSDAILKIETAALLNSVKDLSTKRLAIGLGNDLPRDAIADGDLVSFIHSLSLKIVKQHGGMLTLYLKEAPIYHFRMKSTSHSDIMIFAIVTRSSVEIREFKLSLQAWNGIIILLPIENHNKARPICFLHKGVLVVEEDSGHFLVIDLERRHSARCTSRAFASQKLAGEHRVLFDENSAIYLSLSSDTWLFR
uniref:CNH domain-containing protein n=1 Tax=Candidozyma auris TaxID=498019 RepID=A0A0L0NQ70_CANAR